MNNYRVRVWIKTIEVTADNKEDAVDEPVFIRRDGVVVPSIVTGMGELGITTEHDSFGYDEHGVLWWFTESHAKGR